MLDKERKEEIIREFGKHEGDTGSTEVQIALLTYRIRHLTEHLKKHPHDYHSKRGLLSMVGRRRKLLKYLKKKDLESYLRVTEKLGLKRR